MFDYRTFIPAIKLLRESCPHLDLKSAKDLVESQCVKIPDKTYFAKSDPWQCVIPAERLLNLIELNRRPPEAYKTPRQHAQDWIKEEPLQAMEMALNALKKHL